MKMNENKIKLNTKLNALVIWFYLDVAEPGFIALRFIVGFKATCVACLFVQPPIFVSVSN